MRSVQNARTRIFAAGSDPVFSPAARMAASRRTQPTSAGLNDRLYWQPGFLDRLQSQITRHRE